MVAPNHTLQPTGARDVVRSLSVAARHMGSLVLLAALSLLFIELSLFVRGRERALGVAPTAEVRKAIWVGIAWINAPVLPIMLGPMAIQQLLWPGDSGLISVSLLLLGFIVAWAWWSVTVSMWRRWAAQRRMAPEA